MIKKFMSVEVDTDSGTIKQNGTLIQEPYDICVVYEFLTTFEYLRDCYSNSDDVLWQVAMETRSIQAEYQISENEAIEIACDNLNITLEE